MAVEGCYDADKLLLQVDESSWMLNLSLLRPHVMLAFQVSSQVSEKKKHSSVDLVLGVMKPMRCFITIHL